MIDNRIQRSDWGESWREMAAILRSAAANVANRGQPSTFYNKDKNNPVFQSLDQEIKKFMGYMRKRNAPGYKKPDEEPSSRA